MTKFFLTFFLWSQFLKLLKRSACDFFWESSSENSKAASNDRIYFSSFSKNSKCDGSCLDQLKGGEKQTKIIITLWTHCRVLFPSHVQPVSVSNYSTIPSYTLLSGPSSYHILPPLLKNPPWQLTVNDINQNTSVKHSCFPPHCSITWRCEGIHSGIHVGGLSL